MPIRYLFKQLFLPPGGLLLLLLAAWWLRRRAPRLALLCFCLGFGGLWLMSLPWVVEQAARALEPASALPTAEWSQLAPRVGVKKAVAPPGKMLRRALACWPQVVSNGWCW